MNLYRYVGNDPMNATDPTGTTMMVADLGSGAGALGAGMNSGAPPSGPSAIGGGWTCGTGSLLGRGLGSMGGQGDSGQAPAETGWSGGPIDIGGLNGCGFPPAPGTSREELGLAGPGQSFWNGPGLRGGWTCGTSTLMGGGLDEPGSVEPPDMGGGWRSGDPIDLGGWSGCGFPRAPGTSPEELGLAGPGQSFWNGPGLRSGWTCGTSSLMGDGLDDAPCAASAPRRFAGVGAAVGRRDNRGGPTRRRPCG